EESARSTRWFSPPAIAPRSLISLMEPKGSSMKKALRETARKCFPACTSAGSTSFPLGCCAKSAARRGASLRTAPAGGRNPEPTADSDRDLHCRSDLRTRKIHQPGQSFLTRPRHTRVAHVSLDLLFKRAFGDQQSTELGSGWASGVLAVLAGALAL